MSQSEIKITVRLFAGLRERAGTSTMELHVSPGSTVSDALGAAVEAAPGNLRISDTVMAAVNTEYVKRDHVLEDGDELALIPPVSGGAVGEPMIVITDEPLDPEPYTHSVTTGQDGAVVTFLGVTRDHNEGRSVKWLEYEAYQPMAEDKIGDIVAEMRESYDIGKVAIGHRTGRVDIGETSMVVAVGAAHRRPAFEAALYFVDRLKEIVPIWKKEYFEGGEVWIGDTPGGGGPRDG